MKFTPKTPAKSADFSLEFVPKNPAKFDFFVRDLSEALLRRKGVQISVPPKNENVPQNFSQGDKLSPSDQILAQTLG